ncbi:MULTISPECIES: C45 family peptidase [unclassified Virgibacillus]|uniref:C45 family autoproteolytic acyltransferase/hydolase n=1 Tax=unclassified Virgibacillus TaxID=2620237 RepID=UPI0009322738|nr:MULTISPECIES: C45 family peptidase [unclassified Virgibacillus]
MSQRAKQIKKQTLAGSPYDTGYEHGKLAEVQIKNSLQTYEKMFREYAETSWDEACDQALLHVNYVKEHYPSFLEEMKAIAIGAKVEFEDILVLNCRSEIALTSPDGCSSFALTQPKTEKTWLAQNWDWKREQVNSILHLELVQDNLPTIQMITEAGIIGKIGYNSHGIGVCLNALRTNQWQAKLPIHLGLRAILESHTFEEAISRIDQNQIASAAHFLIASKSKDIISVEVSPVYTEKILPKHGSLQHTNHICSSKMKKTMDEFAKPDSFDRLCILSDLIDSQIDKSINHEFLFQLLANHDNYPNSICRHHNPALSEQEQTETVFSIAMNLNDAGFYWFLGKPCQYF